MNQMTRPEPVPAAMPDAAACWTAFLARDRRQDGCFVGAVLTTGILSLIHI